MKRSSSPVLITIVAIWLAISGSARAEVEWISVTFDNDLFVANDDGYTNGLYVSWWDGPDGEEPSSPGLLAKWMMWSMPSASDNDFDIDIGTLGQTMMTPDDITEDPPTPPPDDLPYAGLLVYTDTFVRVRDNVADSTAVSIGIVGEYSFAEQTQTFVHDITGSDDPCCWDTQLDDEIVFQLRRERIWKTWESSSKNSDFLIGADVALGTLSSKIGASAMFRYGRDLRRSFATAALINNRASNPVAANNGWYLFAGVRAGYLANHVFLDGSRSYDDDFEEIPYDSETLGYTTGLAYSWKQLSVTLAINDANVLEDSDNEATGEYTQYGTFTVAWRVD